MSLWIYGKHACLAALKNKNRKISTLAYLRKEDIENYPIPKGVIFKKFDNKDFIKLLGSSAVHQGIALQVSPLQNYKLDFLATLPEKKQKIVILDHVEDPQNIGNILRSCAAFGAKALIVSEKNAPKETASIIKTASGAYELVPIIRVVNISKAIEKIKAYGFWSIAFSEEAKQYIHEVNTYEKVALVMGSEGQGVRNLVSKTCDLHVKLSTDSFTTLNVAMATTVALYQTHIMQKN